MFGLCFPVSHWCSSPWSKIKTNLGHEKWIDFNSMILGSPKCQSFLVKSKLMVRSPKTNREYCIIHFQDFDINYFNILPHKHLKLKRSIIDPRHHPAPHRLCSMDSKKNPNPLEWAALRPFKSWTPLHGEPGQPPIVWLGLI